MLEFSRDSTNRKKQDLYEQPIIPEYDILNLAVRRVFRAISSGYLKLYQIIDPEFYSLGHTCISIYAAENIQQARSYIEHHLSGVDLYTNDEIRSSLETLREFDLSSQTVMNMDFLVDLYYILEDNDWPGYVGQCSIR